MKDRKNLAGTIVSGTVGSTIMSRHHMPHSHVAETQTIVITFLALVAFVAAVIEIGPLAVVLFGAGCATALFTR